MRSNRDDGIAHRRVDTHELEHHQPVHRPPEQFGDLVGGAIEQSRVGAARDLRDEAVEGGVREVVAVVGRHEPGDRAAEHHHVVGGVRDRVLSVARGPAPEVGERVVGRLVRLHRVDQPFEPLGVELVDDAVLAAEAAVEAHGGAAGGGRDLPDAQRARALLREQLARRLEDPLSLLVTGACHRLPSLFHRGTSALDTCNNDVIASRRYHSVITP